MSTITAVPLRPVKRGNFVRLQVGIALLIAAGVLLAWAGAGRLDALQVKTVKAGSGPTIGKNDGVIIEYTGRLPDGKVFDTTDGRGPAPMLVGQVVPGFAQALQRMQNGGRYTVHIPAKLGYGELPADSPIPSNTALNFDVHVVQVVQNAAIIAAAQQRQMQQQMQQGQLPPQ